MMATNETEPKQARRLRVLPCGRRTTHNLIHLGANILILASLASPTYCLQASNATVGSTTTTTITTEATKLPQPTTTTTQEPRVQPTNESELATSNVNDTTSSELLLLSGEDFVDSREVPSILFEGTSNSDNEPTTTTTSEATTRPTPATQSDSEKTKDKPPASNGTNSSQAVPSDDSSPSRGIEGDPNGQPSADLAPTTTTTSTPPSVPPTSPRENVSTPSKEEEPPRDGADEEEGEEDQDSERDNSESASSAKPFEPPGNIAQYMDYIEKLFHDLRHQITDLFEPHLPQLIRTSQMVALSSSCSYDMLRMALALRQFEPWALRMIDSSGKVPEGIFEGTFTALGSYDECLNTVFQSSSRSNAHPGGTSPAHSGNESPSSGKHDNKPTQGQYCLVTVSPFMPPKPPADRVDRLFEEEANRRNYTRDDQFSRLSPMFYYMKFRIGVCIPSTCDHQDMGSIADALSSSLRLNISIPDCRVRRADDEPLTGHQLAGGLIFGLVCAGVLAATLLDCFKLKWKQIRSQERRLFASQTQERLSNSATAVVGLERHRHFKIRMAPALEGANSRIAGVHEDASASCAAAAAAAAEGQFGERLAKHWAWMSFSLLANFRLYFKNAPNPHTSSHAQPEKHKRSQVVSCLNGIRVLSLCWVIVANSYLTLDPRATKRLTKTREAPRDFLFQVVVQASLAIETFFFLSGLLMSLSFARQLSPLSAGNQEKEKQQQQQQQQHQLQQVDDKTSGTGRMDRKLARDGQNQWLTWIRFYVHRYVRMTPPTMLVIAFSMYAYHLGDGPLWFEATQRVHQSCTQNWWRHLLHVANFIDTRQMCFIHYWYIAADMQLFLFAPILMLLLHKRPRLGYLLVALAGCFSVGSVFYTTYARNLPPTLLFYSTDPESRREFGNTIMTKPFTHALPYLVGMLLGWYLTSSDSSGAGKSSTGESVVKPEQTAARSNLASWRLFSCARTATAGQIGNLSLTGVFGSLALAVALVELFLPYKWNNSHLPSRLCAALYAALFRLGWSLVLAFVVVSCRHRRARDCSPSPNHKPPRPAGQPAGWCFCGSGGSYLNKLLGLELFAHLSKLSFVAYLVHLPLMSVFIGQTRGLFAFSHTLVIHLAISYLVMSFALAFVLAHVIEFPFVTFERLLFDKLHRLLLADKGARASANQSAQRPPGRLYSDAHRAPVALRLEMDKHSIGATNEPRRTESGTGTGGDGTPNNLTTYKL